MQKLENTTLGKYDVIREVGRGSMGIVYLGHDPFAARDVAIKVAHPEELADENSGARFRKLFFNEAKVAGMLRHPNIISVYDAGIETDIDFIVMEYVPGAQTLFEHSKPENLLPMEDVVRIIFKSVRALDYAHRRGVIHRDIKPKNILITQDREVKIGDFSIALTTRLDAADTQVHGYLGSPLYMSPEQIKMESVTNQTDLFSMGVVAYELLTGKHPFAAESLPVITHQITTKKQTPLRELRPDAPKVLEHIIDRMLKKTQAKRYKMGLDIAADLSLVFGHITPAEEELPGQEKFKLVRELTFFNNFADAEIWEVINASLWNDYDPGEEIISEGDVDNSFYVILSGDVTVRKGSVEVDVLRRGDCFGEMGFISKSERTATIIAKGPVMAMQVRSTLMERASLNCQLRFHKAFLYTIVTRLSRTTAQMSRSII